MGNAAYNRLYYQENREAILAQQREYRKENKDHQDARYRAYYEEHREEVLARRKAHYEANKKEENTARSARNHTSLGSECEHCATTENLERHHEDYDDPFEVTTLCRSCHLILHRNEEENGIK